MATFLGIIFGTCAVVCAIALTVLIVLVAIDALVNGF